MNLLPKALGTLTGTVVRGKQLGKTLGVPTVNIPYKKSEICLKDGVYVGAMELLEQNGRLVAGVLNQGYHPTVPDGDPTVEIHLFDFDEILYDQKVRIHYLEFIRDEESFATKEEMRLVMMEDLKYARAWHQHHPLASL